MAPTPWNEGDLVIGEDARKRLNQFVGLLTHARRAWRTLGAAGLLLKADDGSAAAIEQGALLAADGGPGGPWSENAAQLPLVVTNIYGLAAAEHLGALASLFGSGEVIFSAAPIVRAIVEHVARGLWVIDPAITARPRAARAALELLEGARQSRTTAGRLNLPGNHRYAQEHRLQRESIERRFYGHEIDESRSRLTLVGEHCPTMKEAVDRSGEILEWATSGVYDYLANASHPTFQTIVASIQQVPTAGGGILWHAALGDVAYLEKLVRLANGYPLALARYMTSYLGHDNAGLDEWYDMTEEVLPAPVPEGDGNSDT